MSEALKQENKVALLKSVQNIEITERDIPVVGPYDVLIKIIATGICGSDVHYYQYGKIGTKKVSFPIILGHEAAGIVLQVGDCVTKFRPNDRVMIEPGIPCMKCNRCLSGRYNICENVRFLSSTPTDGTFVQFISHPEHLVHAIPEEMPFEIATLAEPLSVGIHACKRANLKPEDIIHISGLGPVGLLLILAAKAFGVHKIIVSDIEESRLKLATILGATKTILIEKEEKENFSNSILQFTNQEGIDLSFDTSGHEKMIADSLKIIKRGGKFIPIGFPSGSSVPIDLTMLLMKEIDIIGIYRYTNTFPLALEILALAPAVSNLITDRYSLSEAKEALDKAMKDKAKSIKVMVYPHNFNLTKEESRCENYLVSS